MLCGGSIGLQANTVTLASGVPLEFPGPPSLQPLQGASALASADRFAGGQHAARIPCFTLAIARYRCGLRLVWHENPSLLFVPPRMKHYTRPVHTQCIDALATQANSHWSSQHNVIQRPAVLAREGWHRRC